MPGDRVSSDESARENKPEELVASPVGQVDKLDVGDPKAVTNDRSGPAARLASLRKARYQTISDAATALGVAYEVFHSHETARRTISNDSAMKYGAHFGVQPGYIIFGEGAPIPVSGIIGPADSVHAYPPGGVEHDGMVVAPPYATPETLAAVRVLGRGLGVAYEPGDIVYYDNAKLGQPFDRRAINGRECIVMTVGGRRLLCRVMTGPNDRVVLLRYTGDPDLGVHIAAATPVLWIRRAQHDD